MEDIVPICLYFNNNTKSSYIGFPTKIHTSDGVKFVCEDKSDCDLVGQFYGVNPDISTKPPGMDLFCAKDLPDSEFATVDLSVLYDPFHLEKGCTKFYAWVEPVPNATPLYVWKSGGYIYASFSEENPGSEYEQLYFSPIYVLVDPRIKNIRRLPGFNNREFEVISDYPQFKFSGYQSRCIPDPNGMSIGKCTMLFGKNILSSNGSEPTLLNYIDRRYNKQTKEIFSKHGMFLVGLGIIIILTILLSFQ